MRARALRSLVFLASGFGLIASAFAAAEFFDATLTKACSPSSFFSCALIAESGKTTTLGVPDWLWGIAGFVAILAIAIVLDRRRRDARVAYLLLAVTSAGVALAAYLLYVELVEIGGICPVCVTAYFFGVLAWFGAVGLARRAYRRDHPRPATIPAPD